MALVAVHTGATHQLLRCEAMSKLILHPYFFGFLYD